MAEGALGYAITSRMKTQLIPAIEAALEGQILRLAIPRQVNVSGRIAFAGLIRTPV
jgi:hypothetical protein